MRMLWRLTIISICCVLGSHYIQVAALAQSPNTQEAKGAATANTKENCPRDRAKEIPQNGSEDFGQANSSWNEPEKALVYYQQALAKGYDTFELRLQLGRLLSGRFARHAEACDQLRIAIQREPDNSRGHDVLASILLANKQYEEALSELEIVGKLDPRSKADGFLDFDTATALDGLGRYEEALKFYQAYLDNDFGPQPRRDKIQERIAEIKRLLGIP